MNGLDILLIAILLLCFCLGIISGFVWQVAGLLSVAVGVLGALLLAPMVANALGRWIEEPQFASLIAYIGLFSLLSLVVRILAVLFSNFLKTMKLERMDRLFGGLLGLIKGFVICAVLVIVFAQYGSSDWQTRVQSSRIGGAIVTSIDYGVQILDEYRVREHMHTAWERVNETVSSLQNGETGTTEPPAPSAP